MNGLRHTGNLNSMFMENVSLGYARAPQASCFEDIFPPFSLTLSCIVHPVHCFTSLNLVCGKWRKWGHGLGWSDLSGSFYQ